MELLEVFKELHFQSMFWLLMLPSAMMAIDVITGLMGAWVRKDFQSTKMRSGLAKKAIRILEGYFFKWAELTCNFYQTKIYKLTCNFTECGL